MPLRAFQPKNLNAQLVDALGKRLVSGYYAEGEKLPVEAELCTEYGVSRPILREVCKILMAKGLLVARPRTGTIVRPRTAWNVLDPEVLSWIIEARPEAEFLDLLFDLRRAFEPGAAELAALNATAEDLEIIALAFQDMEAAENPEALLDPDIRFHQAIMDSTHNELVAYIGRTLHTALAASIRLTSRHPNTHELSLPRHKAVYTAIVDKNPEEAREATLVLLRESRRDFDSVEHK